MPKYESPIQLSDEHMRLIGIIAAHWEAVDVTMQRAICEIMELPFGRTALLAAGISFGDKINILLIYGRHAFENDNHMPVWKEYAKLIERLREANNLRNRYVHSGWSPGKTSELPIRSVVDIRRGKLTVVQEETTVEELEDVAQKIYEAGDAFIEFLQRFDLLQP